MTRSAFLFKLLAVVGIGQGIPPNVPYEQCLHEVPGHKLEWTRCGTECDEGEEKCPLGHCQKPRVVLVQEMLMIDAAVADGHGTMQWKEKVMPVPVQPFEQHVCSVCGIVYVPRESK